jgi:hypothetical protein
VIYRVIESWGCIMASVLDVVGMENDALLSEVERLVKVDRALGATLLVHLGEVDARKLYLARGYSSMFVYCRSALGMSEAEAYLRMRAADVGRRFPLVLERFGSGGVHLSAIKLLAPHLTQDNHAQLLDRVRGMTKREIEVLVAELAPKPDVPARMRKLPERAVKPVAAFDFAAARASTVESTIAVPLPAAASTTAMPPSVAASTTAMPPSVAASTTAMPPSVAASTTAMPPSAAALATEGAPLASQALPAAELAVPAYALQPSRARAVSTPLSPGRFKLELTLGQDAHDQLLQLQALLRHQNPSGDLTGIVERALRELLERTMKRRFAQTRASVKHLARSHDPRESAGDAQEQEHALGEAREEYGPLLSGWLCGCEEVGRAVSRAPGEARDEDEAALADAVGAVRDEDDAAASDTSCEARDEGEAAPSDTSCEARDEDGAAPSDSSCEARDESEAAPSDTSCEARDDMPALMAPCDARPEAEVDADAEHSASLPKSRYVPRKVLREVFARDGGQCTFVSPEGRRCSAREFLEVHHHEPFARGGNATVDNLRLSCRAHNQFLAELDYGRGFMREKVSEAVRASRRGVTAS